MKEREQITYVLEELIHALIRGDMVFEIDIIPGEDAVTLEGDASFRVAIQVLSWVVGREQP